MLWIVLWFASVREDDLNKPPPVDEPPEKKDESGANTTPRETGNPFQSPAAESTPVPAAL
jgi:hypothetical protein